MYVHILEEFCGTWQIFQPQNLKIDDVHHCDFEFVLKVVYESRLSVTILDVFIITYQNLLGLLLIPEPNRPAEEEGQGLRVRPENLICSFDSEKKGYHAGEE